MIARWTRGGSYTSGKHEGCCRVSGWYWSVSTRELGLGAIFTGGREDDASKTCQLPGRNTVGCLLKYIKVTGRVSPSDLKADSMFHNSLDLFGKHMSVYCACGEDAMR